MAIQMRRGLRADFDPTQMLAGEWAVSVDASTANQIVWMCFGAGVVKRMGTYEDFEDMIDAITDDIRDDLLVIKGEVEALANAVSDDADAVALAKTTIEQTDLPAIQSALADAQQSASDASASASSASQSASNASTSATTASEKAVLSQSWAEGGTNTRQGEDTNNAKYWAERAQSASFQQSDWTEDDAQQSAYIAHKPFKTIGTGLSVDANGALNADGTSSYTDLTNKPSIGGVTLSGNKTLTDIGVPTWAQQQSKPSYTAQEVGALPANTQIPSKTSDLTNDSGFITSVPVATSQSAGAVKPDGSTTTVDANGVISVIGGGGGGILPKLTVNSETGATVTATLGQQTVTLTETGTSGVFKGELPDLGTYTITATKSGDTATTTVNVNVVGEFSVNLPITSFEATITVTYPSGATVTCSKTGTTTQTATGSPHTFTVTESGEYTITGTLNGFTKTKTVTITTDGQSESVTFTPTISVTLYSGASDTVSFSDYTGAKTATTDATGTASNVSIVLNELSSMAIQFTSSVAKNPSDLTAYYTKLVYLTAQTTEVYVMPDDALYWYGYNSGKITDASGFQIGYPYEAYTNNTNSISFGPTSGKFTGVTETNALTSGKIISVIMESFAFGSDNRGIAAWYSTTNTAQSPIWYHDQSVINTRQKISYTSTQSGYFSILTVSPKRGAVYALWTKSSSDYNFFSAANDIVTYKDSNNNDVVFAITDEDGYAIVDYSAIPSGTYTLYSSVAKDPDNLSNAYSKTVTISNATTSIYFMPNDNVLYWYGYMSSNCEECTATNGWTVGSKPWSAPTYNTNNISFSISNAHSGIGSKSALSNITKVHAINSISAVTDFGIWCATSKAWADLLKKNNTSANTIEHIEASYSQSSSYTAFFGDYSSTITATLYALWYE